MNPETHSRLGRFATRHSLSIMFVAVVLCLAGIFSALHLPSSVFPQTDFPRVVIIVQNGIMPAHEMMATVTRPIEEAMKEIPGAVSVRSATKRGSAEINIFFNWHVDMQRSELYVLSKLSEIRGDLPATATTEIERLTFSAFPIMGISLTSSNRNTMDLWETANYNIKPRFLQIPGVAKVDLVGGAEPEFHVLVDPAKLQAAHLDLEAVSTALTKNNLIAAAGMMEQNYHLYLTTIDGRVRTPEEIGNVVIAVRNNHPVLIKDVARIERGPEPVFTVVTAQGRNAVLINVQSQPDGSTLDIANALKTELAKLRRELPPDMQLGFYYDQSQFVRDSVGSVWDAIVFGLILSIVILFLFLKNWGSVLTAIVTIPICVLMTFVAMKLAGMSFNMMTLGGIAASIGLIIDDAIVVVEAMFVKIAAGRSKFDGIQEAIGEILHPLIGSTLTPVVVFIPLAFLTGVAGVFFRALALTMVVSLLASLFLALSLTPSIAGWFIRSREKLEHGHAPKDTEGGFILRRVLKLYERGLHAAIRHSWLTLLACVLVLVVGIFIFRDLQTDFLPHFDERGFVIDYWAPAGTSLSETSRILDQAEDILRATPDVEGYSRRLGTEMGMFITEAYRGDFAVKLKPRSGRSTDEVIAELRHKFTERFPMMRFEFPGILSDVVGDLQDNPEPIEIKLYSPDLQWLQETAPRVEEQIKKIPGVVDTFDGLTETGPSINLRVRNAQAQRFGLTAQDIAEAASAAMFGQISSYVLQGDRVVNLRVMAQTNSVNSVDKLRQLPLRTPEGATVQLDQVCDVSIQPSEIEFVRENLRQVIRVTGGLEGRDLGSVMHDIQNTLSHDTWLPPGSVEYGGAFQQQQESFHNLAAVLVMAILLVFIVLLIEFRSFYEPISIIFGAILAMFGTVVALWITGTTLNVVSYLGAIIGVGIVAKNGILMLDFVQHMEAESGDLAEALVRSGHRRLRPVLMTSLAATLGMLPLAFGIGAGADMLRPLAIAVIGALCISVLLSLIATPVAYYILRSFRKKPSAL
ncbi:MAG TPA: efflux RND transporter permease subunit [Candidatus Angelobacter sp.]|nr:efflux RND transporter permease subunit [Candidatus Angelobacter sp.]